MRRVADGVGDGVIVPRIQAVRSGTRFAGGDWIGIRPSDSAIVRGVSVFPLALGLLGLALLVGGSARGLDRGGRRTTQADRAVTGRAAAAQCLCGLSAGRIVPRASVSAPSASSAARKPSRIDRARHASWPRRHALEAEAARNRARRRRAARGVAGLARRIASERSISAAPMPRFSKAGSTVSGPSISASALAGLHRRQAHRADEQRADERREGQIETMRRALAQAEGGAREAARAEGALVQPLDGIGVGGSSGRMTSESSVTGAAHPSPGRERGTG